MLYAFLVMFDYLNESKNQTDVFIEDVSEVKHIWSYLNENNDTGITLSDGIDCFSLLIG